MKHLLTILSLLLAALADAQFPGDYLYQRYNGSAFLKDWDTPSTGGLLFYSSATNITNTPSTAYGRGALNTANAAAFRAYIGVAGSGDVVGPASSTDNNVPQWDGTTGKLLKNGLGTSFGGNGVADAGKLPLFGAEGELKASSVGGLNAFEAFASGNGVGVYGENSGTGPAVVGTATGGGIAGNFTATGNSAVVGTSDTQPGVEAITNNTTEPALLVQNNDAGNTGPLAFIHNNASLGAEFKNDGTIAWTTATGAQGTANGLPVFSATLKGVVPAAGAVPSASKFLDETGGWTVPTGSGVTAVSVATANGLAGSSSGGATPALTLSTTVTGILSGNGTAISAAATTGSGSVVLATSPTLVTPALGTPTALTLTNATGLPAATGLTGQVPIANGGTGQATQTAGFDALSPTTTKGDIIVDNGTDAVRLGVGTDNKVLVARASATNGVQWEYHEREVALTTAGITLTNQPNTLEMLTTANPGLIITKRDLTNYTQVMLSVRVFTASGSGNSPRVILRYYTSASTTAGDWLDIGTSEVSSSMSAAGVIESGWIDLAAGAKIANCYIAPLTTGGNGTADPLIALITAIFR